MRTLTYLGLGVLVCGALVFVASSGAFDSTTADRGVGIETAADEDALLGLEYPSNEGDSVQLTSEQADSEGRCFLGACSEYEYDDLAIVLLEDNSPTSDLAIDADDLSVTVDNEAIVGGDGLRPEPTDEGLRVVYGDFRCPTEYNFLGPYPQDDREATVTIAVEASTDDLVIDLERTVQIECVPDE